MPAAAPLRLPPATPGDRLPAGPPLPAIFLKAALFGKKPSARLGGGGPAPIPGQRREAPEPRLGHHQPPFVVSPPGDGTALPPPRRDLRPPPQREGDASAPDRQGAAPAPTGDTSSPRRPRAESPLRRGMRSPAAPPLLAPPPHAAPLSSSHSPTPYFSCSVGIHMLAACVSPPSPPRRRWPPSASAARLLPPRLSRGCPAPAAKALFGRAGGRTDRPTHRRTD